VILQETGWLRPGAVNFRSMSRLFLHALAWSALATGGIALVISTIRYARVSTFPLGRLISVRLQRSAMPGWLPVGLLAGLCMTLVPATVALALGWGRAGISEISETAAQALVVMLLLRLFLAFAEELLFRGSLLPLLARRTGLTGAVLISGAVYAVAHLAGRPASGGTLVAALVYFVEGCGYGIAFIASRSLWLPITWHAARDYFAWLFGAQANRLGPGLFTLEMSSGAPWSDAGQGLGVVHLMVALALVLLILFVDFDSIVASREAVRGEWKQQGRNEQARAEVSQSEQVTTAVPGGPPGE
jgi:uncharacterized protein